MNLTSNLPRLLPLACEWAKERSHEIEVKGSPLNSEELAIARKVGVLHPEKVRVLESPSLPMPENPLLREAAMQTGLLDPARMTGLTIGHAIFIRSGNMTKRLLSHELRHVHQYEAQESDEMNFQCW